MRRAGWIAGLVVSAWSSVASADVRAVDLLVLQLGTADACAVDVEILDGDGFSGDEALEIAGTIAATLAPLTEGGTTIAPGSHVLFASPQFVTMAGVALPDGSGLAADVMLPASSCARLLPAVQVRFIGTTGSVAGAAIMPGDFGPSVAYGPDGRFDLTREAVYVEGRAGARMIVGTGTPRVPGGCSVTSAGASGAPTPFFALALAALALALRRR